MIVALNTILTLSHPNLLGSMLQPVADGRAIPVRRGAEKEASGKQRAAAKERARLDQARSTVEAALAELEAAQDAEREALAIAKERAAEVRCVAGGAHEPSS